MSYKPEFGMIYQKNSIFDTLDISVPETLTIFAKTSVLDAEAATGGVL